MAYPQGASLNANALVVKLGSPNTTLTSFVTMSALKFVTSHITTVKVKVDVEEVGNPAFVWSVSSSGVRLSEAVTVTK